MISLAKSRKKKTIGNIFSGDFGPCSDLALDFVNKGVVYRVV